MDMSLPPKPTHSREHSLQKPPSPKILNHIISSSPTDVPSPLRDSWSEFTSDEAPPLPPRSHTPDKRLANFFTDQPPSIPRRGQMRTTSINRDNIKFESGLENAISEKPYNEPKVLNTEKDSDSNNLSKCDTFENPESAECIQNIEDPPPIPTKLNKTTTPLTEANSLESVKINLDKPSRPFNEEN